MVVAEEMLNLETMALSLLWLSKHTQQCLQFWWLENR
jgi:hypothetical protein